MKNAKIAFWVILFAFIGLILFQNREFYLSPQSLGIDLMFFQYRTPEIPNAIVFMGFFFVGLLIAYFFSLVERFNSRKTIKGLNDSLRAAEKMLDALKMENEALKNADTATQAPPETVKASDERPVDEADAKQKESDAS
ncbi:MAG: lipopolysaccharide assembly protein LapA domain-containing protein [Deltaproteobacteria bacterium]|nr:lipopolysaccharide assembly protein LapA domain-containing protein [Deltaproteobacteria bacterium]